DVAEVEQLDDLPAQLADLLLADHDLDAARPVAELEEDDLALPATEKDPPGDSDHRAGRQFAGAFLGLRRAPRAQVPDRAVAIEPLAPRIQPQLRDLAELLQPHVLQALPRLVRHRSPYFF